MRFPVFAILCLAATPAFAQNQTAPAQAAPAGPSPEVMAAAQQASTAFQQCIQTAIGSVPTTVTPEAGAASVLSTCAPQRQAVDQAAAALIAAIPEAQRAMVQEQISSQLAGLPAQLAAGITQMRAAPAAAAPAATPAH